MREFMAGQNVSAIQPQRPQPSSYHVSTPSYPVSTPSYPVLPVVILVMFIISCLSYLLVELSATKQNDKPETGLVLYTNQTSTGLYNDLLHVYIYLLQPCLIVWNFILATLYYLDMPFYYAGWVFWCCAYYLFMLCYTIFTHILGLVTYTSSCSFNAVCSFAHYIYAFPIKQLFQPSFDLILIVLYMLWDSLTGVVCVVYELLVIPLSLIKSVIVILFLILCIILYNLVTNLITIVSVCVLSVTDVGLAILPIFMCLLLIFAVAFLLDFVVERLR